MTERTKRVAGYLNCDTCERCIPYTGFGSAEADGGWPLHRCGREIRPFDRWTLDDPNPEMSLAPNGPILADR